MAIKDLYPLTRPSLDLNFAGSRTVDPRITFTRASTATYFDEFGVMRTAPANTPRIDFDPVTGECKGLLIEEQRTRLNFVSATSTVAENVTVTAVAHTVSFYGAGSIVLSGAHVATITGSGAFPTRTNLTFTPTAGTLTITPSGTVQHLQLEVGAFATSVIQGEASQVTRAADTAVMTGTNFSDWYRQDGGTLYLEWDVQNTVVGNRGPVWINNGVNSRGIGIYHVSASVLGWAYRDSAGNSFGIANFGGLTYPYTARVAFSFNHESLARSVNGTVSAEGTDTAGNVAVFDANQMQIGVYQASGVNTGAINATIKRLTYYPKRLTNEQLQSLSA